ncbi:hypothetical protein G6F68_018593 [Rhizopus microsporus]|nr:hypothetical protein G6F68_018593 [Rhizopus microsporus]
MAFAGENAAAQRHLFLLAPVSEVELVRGARKEGVGMSLFFQHGVSLGIMAQLHARQRGLQLTDHERGLTQCDRTAGVFRPLSAGPTENSEHAQRQPDRERTRTASLFRGGSQLCAPVQPLLRARDRRL